MKDWRTDKAMIEAIGPEPKVLLENSDLWDRVAWRGQAIKYWSEKYSKLYAETRTSKLKFLQKRVKELEARIDKAEHYESQHKAKRGEP